MCSRVFIVVYCGLVLATAGFCLTIAGWFTPSNNSFVYGVRRAGPVLLCFGILVIIGSCLMCAIKQDRCFDSCVRCYRDRKRRLLQRHLAQAVADLHAARNHVTDDGQSVLDRLNHSCEVCDAIRRNYVLYVPPESGHYHGNEQRQQINCDVDSQCDLDFTANQSPRLERFLDKNQSRVPPPSCGYQGSDETTDCGDTPSTIPVHNRIFYVSEKQQQVSSQSKNLLDQTTPQLGTPTSVFSTPRSSYAKHVISSETPRDSNDEATRSTPTTTSPVVTPSLLRRYCVNNVRSSRFGDCPSTRDLLAAARNLQTEDDLVWTPRPDQHVPPTEITSLPFSKTDSKSYSNV
ncbi:hypothetical protein LSH36_95g06019 [Paralvinella palmiformis]|uniref:Uncharacterized protein n=1 Tax=Paralvinella palmiformis TaxID=53620 RepID=A0AAD9NBM1_9ANNE|nr:hypothetical protein LSH36_95g06019 [Paralvinella palmiformis]